MRILLIAINAKYIHSNLAVRSLRKFAAAQIAGPPAEDAGTDLSRQTRKPGKAPADAASELPDIEIAEYTINQPFDHILQDIYGRRADMLCFSCYIWNISLVRALVRELGKLLPQVPIWLGGPEVSYHAAETLRELPQAAGIMKGEGEETFTELIRAYIRASRREAAGPHGCVTASESCLADIQGITWRTRDGQLVENPWRPAMDLSRLPFVYDDTEDLSHRIIYYESSRGCPFSCSYCLSSVDRHLRFRDISLVKAELRFFLDRRVPQVKFVDRTFNCSRSRAMEIWRFLIENDNGTTNFHFEIAADLLGQEELELIRAMRPGLIQLEIGVQSTNPDTIREIRRTMDFAQVAANVRAIAAGGNVHQHLDLIAGLPYEDLKSFRRSFDDVYALHPQQLQLGFLKVLNGSFMDERRGDYDLICQSSPPYEVLSTRWLSFDDVIRLKGIEEMVEIYYNSGQFSHTMAELEQDFPSAFDMYEALSVYYRQHAAAGTGQARAARYELLLGFINETGGPDASSKTGQADGRPAYFRELLIYDYYLRENAKSRPAFAGEDQTPKDMLRRFYEREAEEHSYLPNHKNFDKNQLRRMTHLESFRHMGHTILFDYENRDPLTGDARTCCVATKDLVNINESVTG